MNSNRVLATMLMCATGLAASGRTAHAQHLWYDDPGVGDVMMLDVRVNKTAMPTYYETLGWNQAGQGGGYTGIQTHPNGNAFIFSIWDPMTPQPTPITLVYAKPGAVVEPFGGEGTGLHYMDFTLGWQTGHWYVSATRAWADHGHTYFGMWSYDRSGQIRDHLYATFDFPVGNTWFEYGAMSFLENWTGENPNQTRWADYGKGWKRTLDGQWHAFTSANADPDGDFGVESNAFFLKVGTTPVTGFSNPLQVAAPAAPDVLVGTVDTAQATLNAAKQTVTVGWTTVVSKAPQFTYQVDIIDASTHAVLKRVTATAPHIRQIDVPVSGLRVVPGSTQAAVTITDLLDRRSNTKQVAIR